METIHHSFVTLRMTYLCDLPIRDGNTATAGLAVPHGDLCDLPIRDGNPSGPTTPLVKASALRPSYKGWKHGTVDAIFRAVSPLRPSYKGWKHGVFATGQQEHLPLRPSYKGWKLQEQAWEPVRLHALRPSYKGWKHVMPRKPGEQYATFATFL